MASTIPVGYSIDYHASLVKPLGSFTQVDGSWESKLNFRHSGFVLNRVNLYGSMIGGIPQTQEVIDYCAKKNIHPQIKVIRAGEVNKTSNAVIMRDRPRHNIRKPGQAVRVGNGTDVNFV